jgi:hypothetical protein
MRRMGRPRNASQITPLENNMNGNITASTVLSESSTPVSSFTDIHHEQGNGYTTDATSMISTTRAIITPKSLPDSFLAEQGLRGDGSQDNHASSANNEGSQRLRTNSWELRCHIPTLMHARSPTLSNTSENHIMSHKINARTAFQMNAYNTNRPITTESVADCYIAILKRSAKLEESLTTTAPAPPIDLVLEAEQDLRTLQQDCFACTGHGKVGQNCLQPDRPALLYLALLAERVVTMLEETFRLAVHRTTTTYEGVQDLPDDPLPATAARRMERSFRSLLDLPCVFPIPAGNMDIRVGDHVVDGPVKARAVKKILQLRVRKLLLALEQMKTVPRLHGRGKFTSGPLDWGGSSVVLDDAAGHLIKDLLRRMEALQGGLALMG